MKTPTIVAHRGLHDVHTENSLEAFRAAWAAGIEWCECDVRGSADHVPFILHDETLERTTTGKGAISAASRTHLEALAVPSLRQVLDAMPPHGKLLIEIKPKVDRSVVQQTLRMSDPKRCIVQSFDADILHLAASQGGDVPLELLVDDARKPIASGPWRAVNAEFKSLDAESVGRLRKSGFRVGAWTVNEDADIRRIVALNLDTIISDRPLRLRDICNEIA